jgi:hypothetical protein
VCKRERERERRGERKMIENKEEKRGKNFGTLYVLE